MIMLMMKQRYVFYWLSMRLSKKHGDVINEIVRNKQYRNFLHT